MFKSLELKIRENPLILPKPLIQSKSAISKDILIRKSFYCESTLRNAFFFITREIMAVENRQKFVKHLAIFHTQQLVKIFKIPFIIMFQVPELVESGIYRVQHFPSWQSQESTVSSCCCSGGNKFFFALCPILTEILCYVSNARCMNSK